MKEEIKLKPSEELAYWIGVAQSDGCFVTRWKKDRKFPQYSVALEVGKKSLPMLLKFRDLSDMILKRKASIWKRSKKEYWQVRIGVSRFLEHFDQLDIRFKDPPTPPSWSLQNPAFFGAYLAGLIDGDGNVYIRKSKYTQCSIRIASSLPQTKLCESIRTILNCGVSVDKKESRSYLGDRYIEGTCYVLEFFVSPKTYKFVEEFILPCLQLAYKKAKVKTYIDSRWSS